MSNKIFYKIPNEVAFQWGYNYVKRKGGGFACHPSDQDDRIKPKVRKVKLTKLHQIQKDLDKSGIEYTTVVNETHTIIKSVQDA